MYCYVTQPNHYCYPMFSPVNICYSKVSLYHSIQMFPPKHCVARLSKQPIPFLLVSCISYPTLLTRNRCTIKTWIGQTNNQDLDLYFVISARRQAVLLHGDLSEQKGGHNRHPGPHRVRRGRQTECGLPSGQHVNLQRVRYLQRFIQRNQADTPTESTIDHQVSSKTSIP